MSSLKNEMTELHERAKIIVKLLQDKISELPDNPNIERIGNSGAFLMNISQVFSTKTKNLSADYYDFKYQYRALVKNLEHTEPGNVFKLLEQICKDEKIKTKGEIIKFHPDVISHLKKLL